MAKRQRGKDPGWMYCCGGLTWLVVLYLSFTSWGAGSFPLDVALPILVLLVGGISCVGFLKSTASDDETRGASTERGVYHPPVALKQAGQETPARRGAKSMWASDMQETPSYKSPDGTIRALRGGEIVGSRFRFKVKVANDSDHIINDVTVFVLSYPRDTLQLASEDDDCQFSKIEPGGFRSPHFDFRPTQDCIRGDIVAGVSYVDPWGKAHTLATRPFTIRAVCDLLKPEAIGVEEFRIKLEEFEAGEIVVKVEEWSPEEMYEKALKVLDDSNFHEVESTKDDAEGVFSGRIAGWARGRYTGKTLGVEVSITGPVGRKGASCRIRVAGEDDAMILPAIDDLQDRLSAYLCPMCFSKLTVENVRALKAGKPVTCPFCGVAIGK
jgi:hypothetical protein